MSDFRKFENLCPGKHLCIATTASVPNANPIRVVHEHLLLIFIVERSTGKILALDVNTTCKLTAEFIRAMFVGRNLISDTEEIKGCIQENYLGASAKALVVAMGNARQRLMEHLKID